MADNTAASPEPDDDGSSRYYTAAEVLTVALDAYGRGFDDGVSDTGRTRWRDPDVINRFREQRVAAELAAMKEKAEVGRLQRGRREKFEYRGGPVDWSSGLPAGSACAWLHRQRARPSYDLAGGGE